MKTYRISLDGCDDSTEFDMDLTDTATITQKETDPS